MSDYTSTTMDAQVAAEASAGNIIADANLLSGRTQFLQAAWDVPAGTADSETVDLCYCPANATLVPGATITVSAAGGANTLDLELEDGTAICTGIDISAAGTVLLPLIKGSVVNTTKQKIVAVIDGGALNEVDLWFNFPFTSGE